MVKDIVTPCCGAPLHIATRSEGSPYLTYEAPDEISCLGSGCYNSWDETGVADDWNVYPDVES